jgi:hypothetical protein
MATLLGQKALQYLPTDGQGDDPKQQCSAMDANVTQAKGAAIPIQGSARTETRTSALH